MVIEDDEELELTDDDMYSDGFFVKFDDGTKLLQREIDPYIVNPGDDYYPGTFVDRLDTIAYDKYLNSKLWWNIADANSIFNPFSDLSGIGLIIPKLEINNNQDGL